jgi:hypothetical protein
VGEAAGVGAEGWEVVCGIGDSVVDGCDTDGVGLDVGAATPEQADITSAAISEVAFR